jgi:hypothetical protein
MLTDEEERIYAEIDALRATAAEAKKRADEARQKGDLAGQKLAHQEQLTALTRVIELLQLLDPQK